jgi:hypothetical protein
VIAKITSQQGDLSMRHRNPVATFAVVISLAWPAFAAEEADHLSVSSNIGAVEIETSPLGSSGPAASSGVQTDGVHIYSIDYSTSERAAFFLHTSRTATKEGRSCKGLYDNGVVRSWYLTEKNLNDYRESKNFCRDMLANGTLDDPDYARVMHFSYSGDGTQGNASIPLEMLPVGLGTKWDTRNGVEPIFNFIPQPKLRDIELHYLSARDVQTDTPYFESTGWALGNSGHETVDLMCSKGFVMTGLWVWVDRNAGGSNQAEIQAVEIECSLLR